jgi:hypothetical protein
MVRQAALMENSIQKFGSGIDAQGNPYDALYVIDGSLVYVISPKISREENERRINELGSVIGSVFNCTATVSYKKSPRRA